MLQTKTNQIHNDGNTRKVNILHEGEYNLRADFLSAGSARPTEDPRYKVRIQDIYGGLGKLPIVWKRLETLSSSNHKCAPYTLKYLNCYDMAQRNFKSLIDSLLVSHYPT